MTRRVDIGLVDTAELSRIFDAILMIRLEGNQPPGLVVFCANGRRTWLISTNALTIVVTGDGADFEGAFRLPVTIVANAGRHNASGGAVSFWVVGDTVTSESARGRQSVSCTTVPVPSVRRPSDTRDRVSATLNGKDLTWVAFSGANQPIESTFIEDGDRQNPDHFTVSVEDGRLVVSSDWTPSNLYPMTASTAASTRGCGQIRLQMDFLPVILSCVDSDSDWTISFDPRRPREIELRSDVQHITSTMTKVPVFELHERVVGVLEREEFEFQTGENGVVGVRIDGVTISLDFYQREHTELPLLRASTMVMQGANESGELLREINAHNHGGSVTRLWFDNGNVHLGLDLLPDNLFMLSGRLRNLTEDAGRVRGILEPFAAEAALPARPQSDSRRPVAGTSTPRIWD